MDRNNIRLLIVDDEKDIRDGLREYLELEGFVVDAVSGAEEALVKGVDRYDLLLLDVMMEGTDGFEFARQLKQTPCTSDIPIIFLTARDTNEDMVFGLNLGADDYVAKPFSMNVLIARIEAVMRRMCCGAKARGVVCDRTRLTCLVDGAEVKLPRKEFEILAFLLDNPGRIFSREELLRRIWPENVVVVDRSVDVHVARIRSKIVPYGSQLVARSGYGYGWQD